MRSFKYIFMLFDYLIRSWAFSTSFVNQKVFNFKSNVFKGYYIKYGVFDKESKRFFWIYDYDSLLWTFLVWLENGLSEKHSLIPISYAKITNDQYVCIGSYIEDDKQVCEFHDVEMQYQHKLETKFIYCVVDDSIDMTHEFQHFRESIVKNTTLSCKDILILLCYFYSKNYTCKEDFNLKLIMDDTFHELSFKANDKLIIHNGGSSER
jgi:hypothetical protein